MRPGLVLAIAFVANACASADQPQAGAGMRDVDEAKMQQVEDAAARRGVRIQWLNPPRKQSAPSAG